MSGTILNVAHLDALDPTKVAQCQAFITQLVQERNPAIDAKRGPVHDIILYFSAILAAWNQGNLDLVNQSMSLQAIQSNPTLADPTLVAAVLSSFGITPLAAAPASGPVVIEVSALQPVTIAANQIFVANGLQFAAVQAYSARTSAALVQGPNDVALTPLSNGNYAFTIQVTALTPGSASTLLKNTLVVPQGQPPQAFVTAYAGADFTGGIDQETNAQVILRMQLGMAAKTLSGRTNMLALLKEASNYPLVTGASVIGFGDPEMLRDQHTIFPMSLGGKLDWYVRTQPLPQQMLYNLPATLIAAAGDGYGIWQIALNRAQFAGGYDVQIVQTGAIVLGTGYAVQSDVRQADLTDPPPLPDIVGAVEAAYSAYQTAIIQFKDSDTPIVGLTVGTTVRNYDVTVRGMPQIAAIQGSMGARGVRPPAHDLLVKAPIPCFVSVGFTINIKNGDPQPNVAAIANAIATAVNNYGFTGRLPASLVAEIAQQNLSGSESLSAVNLLGRIRRPDGSYKVLASREAILVPTESGTLVSPRTVAFFLQPADVGIAVQIVNIPEV